MPADVPGAYDYTGFRVPCCVVSAWSKKDYVSHQVFDHTSILKLVETKWNLPALTYRDANAHNMLDFFDLKAKRPPFADPPVWPHPGTRSRARPHSRRAQSLLNEEAMFHTICTELPSGTLPPATANVTTIPPHAAALMAAQQRRVQREIAQQ